MLGGRPPPPGLPPWLPPLGAATAAAQAAAQTIPTIANFAKLLLLLFIAHHHFLFWNLRASPSRPYIVQGKSTLRF